MKKEVVTKPKIIEQHHQNQTKKERMKEKDHGILYIPWLRRENCICLGSMINNTQSNTNRVRLVDRSSHTRL
jgi:hypothetical protein